MPLVMLGSSSYRGELGPISESGREYTHLATLSVASGEAPVRAYVKVYPSGYQSGAVARGLINELVGYFCAERGGLSVPPRAGLIELEVGNLSSPPLWLAQAPAAIGWWTEDAGHQSIKASLDLDALPDGSATKRRALGAARDFLLRHEDAPAVIAFDDLVANVDRNLGNLLSSPGKLTLIDHGRALTGPVWVKSDLVPGQTYQNVVRSFLNPESDSLPYKSRVMAEYTSIVSQVSPAMADLKTWLDGLLAPDEANAVHSFLVARTARQSIAQRVGVVA